MTQPYARILVVDDEVVIRHTLATLLRRQGYAVWTATDSVEAEVLLRNSVFDLLLLDLYLPGGVSGLDIAQSAHVYQPNAVVLILTGSDAFADIVSDVSIQKFEIIFKTAGPQDVLDRVAVLLTQRQKRYEITQNGNPAGILQNRSVNAS
ncbi:MAG: response regulator [Roseiflexaceae bacterium]|nr:response regulator [Roseiflexaceae bacterium]